VLEKKGEGTPTDTVLLYSRTKKAYEGKQYIKDAVAPMLRRARDAMGINVYLDGEVYQHGISLQTLSGEMRQSSGKEDPNIRMTFHIFDLFVPDQPQLTYVERKRILDDLFVNMGDNSATMGTGASAITYLKNVETFHTTSRAEIDALYASFLEAGFEGAIVRIPDRAYEYSHKGYHSSALLKMKPCFDSEYEIIGYKGEEGKGKAEGSVMWIVKTEDGIPFDVTPMGTIESRVQLFGEMREVVDGKTKFEREYLGRMLTVRYDDLSDDGVPLRARGVALRDYE
jgi:ATP-dependent DNA ligase